MKSERDGNIPKLDGVNVRKIIIGRSDKSERDSNVTKLDGVNVGGDLCEKDNIARSDKSERDSNIPSCTVLGGCAHPRSGTPMSASVT